MKHNLELKVQAWLDGQLSASEAGRIAGLVARDPEAAALAAQLGAVRQAMSRAESPAALPDSREFYWSKIQRQIEREAAAPRPAALPWYASWRRFMAPLTGVAVLGCALLLTVHLAYSPTFDEISSIGEGTEAVTFRDQSAQMTIVWLQDKDLLADDQPAQETIPDAANNEIGD
jgi:anti-sigma factor RsiW